ncbi:MAG: ABC-F family ATP-binding cassette domain-containing protein [Thermoanaerobaculia bacterium]|nr:ABC-F family ATP-binding cassette domain-containing protein [Thermoanaerobaculia bacterium]
MIAVSNLSKAYGRQTLFEEVSFQLTEGNRYGLVGANGSGKSTLLRLLAGEEPPSDGTIAMPKRARLGVLKQDHYRYEDDRILDVALMGNEELWQAIDEKEKLLARADESFDTERYAELEEIVLKHDGYSAEARAAEILEGLGIPTEVHEQPLSTLSGGFKLRVLLAQVLTAEPDVLLLDEPTNHLDILSIRWLEKFLTSFTGIVVAISHDHRFLDNISTHILDVDYETVTLYTGNYSRFERAKIEERQRREHEIEKREREIEHHKAFVERFRAKATKARQAKSKQKLIDRVVIERLPQSSRRYPTFRFEQVRPSGKDVLDLDGISKAYRDRQVLTDVSLTVRRGDRLAIMGPNGIGKSTLLKIAMGEVEPDAGEVSWGYETYPGYFAQDHHEILRDEAATVESWLWEAAPGETIGQIKSRLALVLFSGDESKKQLDNLSGGEAARLVFARLSLEQPNVLVLDEPTNHLDLEAIEALVEGLEDYDGTLILVSHDRWFVSQLADRILEIRPDGITDYRGTYDEYVAYCGDDHLDADSVSLRVRREKKGGAENPTGPPRRRTDRRKLEREQAELAERIEVDEARIGAINELFCDPAFFERTPHQEVNRLEREQSKLAERVEELTERWEVLEMELSEIEV